MKRNNYSIRLSLLFLFAAHFAPAQINLSFTTSNHNGYSVSCFGGTDGQISVTATGGTAPYSYSWSNAATTSTITGLAADYYSVTVTDANSLTATDGINLKSPLQIKITLTSPKYGNSLNVSCYQCYNGSITSSVNGGVSSYTYLWNDGPTTQNRSGLGKGVYGLIVTDANGCLAAQNIILTEPDREDWSLNGVSGSNPPTQFIGTTDSKDFVIKTNGAERLKISANGNITMQATTKFEKLIASRISSPDSLIYVGDSTIIFQPNYNRFWGDPNSTLFRGLGIGVGTAAYGQFSTAIGHGCRIGDSGGAIGSNADETILIGSGLTATPTAIGSIVMGSGINGGARMYYGAPHSLAIGFNSDIPTFVVTQAGGTGTTGNVGIGTANIPTGFKLAVRGNIMCEEVKVALYNTWDIVFAKDYKLKSLDELEEFVNYNHHLPDVPSAEEMKKENGILVGDFQMRLLKTIEELTLHVIEQSKEINSLKQEVGLLKK